LYKGELESLISKAKTREKNYEWLQAAETYRKAANIALKEKSLSKAAEFQGRLGFCFYKAAFQAQTTAQFRNRMKLAIQFYEKESKLLSEVCEEENQVTPS